jgi:hypothetical protein
MRVLLSLIPDESYIRYQVSGIRYQVSGTVSGIRYQVSGETRRSRGTDSRQIGPVAAPHAGPVAAVACETRQGAEGLGRYRGDVWEI